MEQQIIVSLSPSLPSFLLSLPSPFFSLKPLKKFKLKTLIGDIYTYTQKNVLTEQKMSSKLKSSSRLPGNFIPQPKTYFSAFAFFICHLQDYPIFVYIDRLHYTGWGERRVTVFHKENNPIMNKNVEIHAVSSTHNCNPAFAPCCISLNECTIIHSTGSLQWVHGLFPAFCHHK